VLNILFIFIALKTLINRAILSHSCSFIFQWV
jgi:hypothetical protein